MGRQSESTDDDAAKAVVSASSPRLRQAPAHARADDSFARPRQEGGGGRAEDGGGLTTSNNGSQQKREEKSGIALAPGSFSEDSKEKIRATRRRNKKDERLRPTRRKRYVTAKSRSQ